MEGVGYRKRRRTRIGEGDRNINYFIDLSCPFLLPITHHQNVMLPIQFCSGVEAHYRKREREVSGRRVLQYLNRIVFYISGTDPVLFNICTVCHVNTTYSGLSKHAAAQL